MYIRGMFHRTGVTHDRSFTLRDKDFLPFCSCDLSLDPMTFIYELDLYSLEIYRMCKYELPTLRLSKVIVWQTVRQTQPKLYTTSLRRLCSDNMQSMLLRCVFACVHTNSSGIKSSSWALALYRACGQCSTTCHNAQRWWFDSGT